jgi:UDP-glucuronate 4-epimerase
MLMSAIVTGAAGFSRSHLVELLAARSERVVAVDRRPGAPASAAACMVADLVGPDPDRSVGDALRGADAVFHLAARPGVRDARPEVDGLRHRDNVLAAERVLRTVPPSVPVVVASSSSSGYGGAMYGGRLHPSRESDPAASRRLRALQGRAGAALLARPVGEARPR